MKKILFIVFLFSGSVVLAQGNLTSLQYSVGFGTGDLNSFISKPSFRGFTFDYRKLVQPNIGVGVEAGWNVFYEEKGFATYEGEINGQPWKLTSKQWRYNNQFPLLFATDYYLSPDEQINPFVGLGIGTMYSLRNTDVGTVTLEQDAWHFALRPEFGIMVEANPEFSFSVTAKYYYGFEAGDLPAQSYFALNFGFVFGN